jgi:hypothetical protein
MQRLQVELVSRLGRDKFHRRPLHRLCDRFGVGWGTAVAKDRVWISSFNGKILRTAASSK